MNIGVRLALDDFGTGYASLAYLLQFRFDKIKIDRSFVGGLGTDPNASVIVRAVIGQRAALDMRIVAEGVEDDEAVATLRALGCGVAPGLPVLPADAGRGHGPGGQRAAHPGDRRSLGQRDDRRRRLTKGGRTSRTDKADIQGA